MKYTYKLDQFLAIKRDSNAPMAFDDELENDEMQAMREAYLARQNIGIDAGTFYLSISGTIANVSAEIAEYFGLASIPEIKQALIQARANPEVERICIVANSGGGETQGIADIYDLLYSAGKPTLAYIDGQCCSACYWIASACDQIIATRGSTVGSIGVILSWQCVAEADKKQGIKTELFSTGNIKGAGNAHVDLTEDQREFFNSHINSIYVSFCDDIKRKRPAISDADFSGAYWLSTEALKKGFIDRIA